MFDTLVPEYDKHLNFKPKTEKCFYVTQNNTYNI